MASASSGTHPYTGTVIRGGPADTREVGGLRLSKVTVGDFDNNVYLLRCLTTGDQLLIDAANEPDRLLELIGRRACRPSSPPTATSTTSRRWKPSRGPPAPRGSRIPTTLPNCRWRRAAWCATATRSASARRACG